MAENTRMRIHVAGRVQGVLFRQSAKVRALELGLTGWAKNLLDGTVEIIVEGPKDKADEFVEWAQHGPLLASVEKADIAREEYKGEFEGFIVREFGF